MYLQRDKIYINNNWNIEVSFYVYDIKLLINIITQTKYIILALVFAFGICGHRIPLGSLGQYKTTNLSSRKGTERTLYFF